MTRPLCRRPAGRCLAEQLFQQRESFVFETVFSGPEEGELGFLTRAAADGYNIILCFVGIAGPEISDQRVAMRVSPYGHNVAKSKLLSRFPLPARWPT